MSYKLQFVTLLVDDRYIYLIVPKFVQFLTQATFKGNKFFKSPM